MAEGIHSRYFVEGVPQTYVDQRTLTMGKTLKTVYLLFLAGRDNYTVAKSADGGQFCRFR